jgi:hypothetical protein
MPSVLCRAQAMAQAAGVWPHQTGSPSQVVRLLPGLQARAVMLTTRYARRGTQ